MQRLEPSPRWWWSPLWLCLQDFAKYSILRKRFRKRCLLFNERRLPTAAEQAHELADLVRVMRASRLVSRCRFDSHIPISLRGLINMLNLIRNRKSDLQLRRVLTQRIT